MWLHSLYLVINCTGGQIVTCFKKLHFSGRNVIVTKMFLYLCRIVMGKTSSFIYTIDFCFRGKILRWQLYDGTYM